MSFEKIGKNLEKIGKILKKLEKKICKGPWNSMLVKALIEIYLRFDWNIPEICLQYTWDKLDVNLRYTCGIPEIYHR